MNMTPMIDCTMLLLVFFMVTSKFKSAEADILSLAYARNADRIESVEKSGEIIGRFVINVRHENPGKKGPVVYTVRGVVFRHDSEEGMKRLGNSLKAFKRDNPKGEVMVRVDKDIEYVYVKRLQTTMRDYLAVTREQELKVSYSVDPNPPEQVSQ